jgi:hypothetical protein
MSKILANRTQVSDVAPGHLVLLLYSNVHYLPDGQLILIKLLTQPIKVVALGARQCLLSSPANDLGLYDLIKTSIFHVPKWFLNP